MSEEQVANVESGKKSGSRKVAEVVKNKKAFRTEIDTAPEEVVKCLQEGREILFDRDDLPVFSEEELELFPYKVVKAYRAEKAHIEEKKKVATGRIEVLGNNATNRLKLRKRRGYHQVWKRPDEYDEALNSGYVVIRKAEKDDKVGKESGDVQKIETAKEVELIAMEISQERYDNHLIAVHRLSTRAYKANKENLVTEVGRINTKVKDKADRMIVVDDEGDV